MHVQAMANPNKSLVKVFVVRYDLADMPPSHRTFVRQRQVTREGRVTRHAIHVSFVTNSRGHVYLAGPIRALFTAGSNDEALDLECLHPGDPRFSPRTD